VSRPAHDHLQKDTPDDVICRDLLRWFDAHQRSMPWRKTRDPYRIWLSEVMLQQTQVDTVIPYYNRFVQRYPQLHNLAQAPEEEVLKLWEGLGYYRRCHHFIQAVRDVQVRYGGTVPDDPDAFRALPGVGDYTTAAVLSIAYGRVLPVVDGNVIRVMTRVFRISGDVGKAGTKKQIHAAMGRIMSHERPGDFNQAVMELGALVCTPRQPRCGSCPIVERCGAFLHDETSRYPLIEKKAKVPEYKVGLALIFNDGRFLIQKRPSSGHLAGLWELPGGKAGPGETVEQALLRKCREDLGLDVDIREFLGDARHVYSHFKIHVTVYRCHIGTQQEKALRHQPLAWISEKDIDRYPFPAANHRLFKKIF